MVIFHLEIFQKQLSRIHSQRGNFMVGMTIALLAASIYTIGLVRTNINSMNTTVGTVAGNQLQLVVTGLNSYISANSAGIAAGTVTGVAVATAPTVAELKTLGYLSSTINTTPTYGTAYVTTIAPTVTGCTSSCTYTGTVYLQNPVGTVESRSNGKNDIRVLQAASNASTTSQIGYSIPGSAATINGPGWSVTNPDPAQRAGILLASTANVATATQTTQYWLKSASTYWALPSTGNTLGDGRLAQDTSKPYQWNGSSWQELFSNSSTSNLSIGPSSGASTVGTANTLVGTLAGQSNTGSGNVYVGYSSGRATYLNTPSGNTFVGRSTGESNSANGNVFIGYYSGYANTSGRDNVFTGYTVGYNNTTGLENVFTGYGTAYANTTGSYNTFTGNNTGRQNTTGGFNVFTGRQAGYANTIGHSNVFTGAGAGYSNTGGYLNVFTGHYAGQNNTLGYNNVFTGANAGASNTTGYQNVFSGYYSGYKNTTGYDNVFIGRQAGMANTTSWDNVFVGNNAGLNNLSYRNTYVGSFAGRANTSGQENTFFGAISGSLNTTGLQNSFIGGQAGYVNTSGSRNAYLGYNTGLNNTTGDNNTAAGNSSGPASDGLTNTTSLGYGAQASSSNAVRIGNTSITQIGGQVAWSNLSDRRLKTDIKNSERGLAFINQLRPVDYILKDNKKPETGFIAQEVEAVDSTFPGINKPANDKSFYSLAYTDFIPSLVKSVQELDQKLESKQSSLGSHSDGTAINYLIGALAVLFAWNCYLQFSVSRLKRRVAANDEQFKKLA